MATRSLAWAAGVFRHAAESLAKRNVGSPTLAEILDGGSYADAASRAIEYLTDGRPRIASEDEAIAAAAAIGAFLKTVPEDRRAQLAKTILQAIPAPKTAPKRRGTLKWKRAR